MKRNVEYTISYGTNPPLTASTKRELVKYLRMFALAAVTRQYGFIARKMVNNKVTERYEVNVSVTLKKQPE